MPVRIATGPFDNLPGLKDLLFAQPAAIEDGFRIVEVDLPTADAGTVDFLGIDSSGALTLVAISADDPDGALLRLLDQCRWARADQRILARAFPEAGGNGDLKIRCILLAPSFSYRFLQRLALLGVPITPSIVRRLESRIEVSLLIEPALPLFGLEPAATSGPATAAAATLPAQPVIEAARRDAAWERSEEGFRGRPGETFRERIRERPYDRPSERRSRERPVERPAGESQSGPSEPTRDQDDEPLPVFPWDDEAGDDAPETVDIFADSPVPAPEMTEFGPLDNLPPVTPADLAMPIEPLTAEEIAEFERFDSQRRKHDRGTS